MLKSLSAPVVVPKSAIPDPSSFERFDPATLSNEAKVVYAMYLAHLSKNFDQGDSSFIAQLAADIVWTYSVPSAPYGGTYRDTAGVYAYFGRVAESGWRFLSVWPRHIAATGSTVFVQADEFLQRGAEDAPVIHHQPIAKFTVEPRQGVLKVTEFLAFANPALFDLP